MNDRTILVTGATDGIGRQTAQNLAQQGVRVLVHGRSATRIESTVQALKAASGNPSIEGVLADFTSLTQIRTLAQELHWRTQRLDALIHNAGIYMKTREVTEDGLETTFQVNHLAPFLLTHLVADLLQAAPKARVIGLSSILHQSAVVDFENLQGEKHFDGYSAYALSKLGVLLFTFELANRWAGTSITANALHPGAIGTKMLRDNFDMGGASIEQGARTPTYLALSPEVEGATGRYFVDCKPTVCSDDALDPMLRKRFWEISSELVGIR